MKPLAAAQRRPVANTRSTDHCAQRPMLPSTGRRDGPFLLGGDMNE